MNRFRSKIVLGSLLCFSFGISEKPVDYLRLSHDIAVEQLRAGVHDAEGLNTYYFTVEMHGLIFSKDEAKKKLADRKKITIGLGKFGDFLVKPLDFWDKAADPVEGVAITGDQIRGLVSQMMQQFAIQEIEVAILVEIHMWEQNQRFGFYGEDQAIGTASYYAIPESLPRRPNTKDLHLEITDDKGTLVGISVAYEANKKMARKK